MAEHTKGKLEIERPCGFPYTGIYIVSHQANNDKDFHSFIAEVRQYREKGEGEANAERLVKCWNCHDELVAALDKIRREEKYRRKLCGTSDLSSSPIPEGIIEKIAVVALAEVENKK